MGKIIKSSIGSMKRHIYECRMGGFVLESFRSDRFQIRQSELRNLNLSDLPKNINLIVCDSDSLTEKVELDLVIMVKRVEDGKIRFIFEESSQSERWVTPDLMEAYFYHRIRYISSINLEDLRIVMMQEYFDFNSMILKYSTDVLIESVDKIIEVAFARMEKILSNCANFSAAV
jgi:hypothetical protein